MLISIVVPAFNEEAYLGETLASLNRAKAFLQRERGLQAEIIVVDNDSDDATADVARALGATVARETQHNVAKVRNTGAKLSRGETIVFVDADTVVPDNLLSRIVDAMSDGTCFGGAVDTDYRPMKLTVKAYLQFWRVVGKLMGMAQGATQFCRRDIFFALNGYDETLFMGEDVDFHWRLKRIAKRQSGGVVFIADIRVVPSTRRFDQWRLWRTLVWTNPLFMLMFRRSRTCWQGWYKATPR
jgi:glycosyltransferase involved in cell wall biosynthesis